MAIVNDDELKKDCIEGMASELDIDYREAEELMNNSRLEYIIDAMYMAQSEAIERIASEIERN
jgi:hypothetical protein